MVEVIEKATWALMIVFFAFVVVMFAIAVWNGAKIEKDLNELEDKLRKKKPKCILEEVRQEFCVKFGNCWECRETVLNTIKNVKEEDTE